MDSKVSAYLAPCFAVEDNPGDANLRFRHDVHRMVLAWQLTPPSRVDFDELEHLSSVQRPDEPKRALLPGVRRTALPRV